MKTKEQRKFEKKQQKTRQEQNFRSDITDDSNYSSLVIAEF
jgi:hypothetical protein